MSKFQYSCMYKNFQNGVPMFKFLGEILSIILRSNIHLSKTKLDNLFQNNLKKKTTPQINPLNDDPHTQARRQLAENEERLSEAFYQSR